MTAPEPGAGDPSRERDPATARLDARHAVDRIITKLAVDGYGGTVHEDPIPGYKVLTRRRFDPATAALQAAVAVRNVAESLIHDHAMKARAEGTPWEDIGRALGFDGDDWADQPVGDIAYRVLVWDEDPPDVSPTWSRREGNAYWECRSCGERIKDTGPFESHPDDTEHGHTETCARHTAAVAAWKARTGWDDE